MFAPGKEDGTSETFGEKNLARFSILSDKGIWFLLFCLLFVVRQIRRQHQFHKVVDFSFSSVTAYDIYHVDADYKDHACDQPLD